MTKPFGEDWDDNSFPAAYLITFRAYGTWLHGDERGAVDVHRGQNRYRALKVPDNPKLESLMSRNMKQDPFLLDEKMRATVDLAIRQVCDLRGYDLLAINVRTNHVHAVVAAQCKPEHIADSFKSYSTRELRRECLIDAQTKPWSRGRSRKYLWKSKHVDAAIWYVLYSQGKLEFEVEAESLLRDLIDDEPDGS
jgi:REP element-mobilizing transposase RayT